VTPLGDRVGVGSGRREVRRSREGAGVRGRDICTVGLNDVGHAREGEGVMWGVLPSSSCMSAASAFEVERNPLGYNPRQAVVGSGWTRASEVGTTWVRSSWQPSSR
jgi:hypothetical protein